ncbi:MAG: PstA family ABC transporter permease, partial [Acidimicrobiia bacterium]
MLPAMRPPAPVSPERRRLGGVTTQDVIHVVGALGSAICIGLLLFGRIAPLEGPLGFVVVTYAAFLVIYAALVWQDDEVPAVVDKVMSVVLSSVALLAGAALASVILFTLLKGRGALSNLNLYVEDMSNAGPTDPLSVGGISHALVGTLIMLTIALAITVPLGVTCAVFLTETGGRGAGLVRTIVNAMTALPSVLSGLFIFATWVLILGYPRSGLAAGLAISIMMLPIIIRSSDVVLRLVPGNLREASAAMGAPTWRTVWHVVLPTARSGLATSIILGVARGVGETSPVLLTAGFTSTMNLNPLKD